LQWHISDHGSLVLDLCTKFGLNISYSLWNRHILFPMSVW